VISNHLTSSLQVLPSTDQQARFLHHGGPQRSFGSSRGLEWRHFGGNPDQDPHPRFLDPITIRFKDSHQPPTILYLHAKFQLQICCSLLFEISFDGKTLLIITHSATHPSIQLAHFDTPEPQLRWGIGLGKTHLVATSFSRLCAMQMTVFWSLEFVVVWIPMLPTFRGGRVIWIR